MHGTRGHPQQGLGEQRGPGVRKTVQDGAGGVLGCAGQHACHGGAGPGGEQHAGAQPGSDRGADAVER